MAAPNASSQSIIAVAGQRPMHSAKRLSSTPNPDYWGSLYNRLIAEARERGALIILNSDRDDPSAYAVANQAIID
jgi:hypothetical protein